VLHERGCCIADRKLKLLLKVKGHTVPHLTSHCQAVPRAMTAQTVMVLRDPHWQA
jgi:hypothetical protein